MARLIFLLGNLRFSYDFLWFEVMLIIVIEILLKHQLEVKSQLILWFILAISKVNCVYSNRNEPAYKTDRLWDDKRANAEEFAEIYDRHQKWNDCRRIFE